MNLENMVIMAEVHCEIKNCYSIKTNFCSIFQISPEFFMCTKVITRTLFYMFDGMITSYFF